MLYLDSSVLIKHYQKEDGSEALERKLQVERENSSIVFTSVLTYAEIHAIIARRDREPLLTPKEAPRCGQVRNCRFCEIPSETGVLLI